MKSVSVESIVTDFVVVSLGRVEVTGVHLQVLAVLNGRVDHQEQVANALLIVDVQREKLDQAVVILEKD